VIAAAGVLLEVFGRDRLNDAVRLQAAGGMRVEFPEVAGEGELLVAVDLLVAEEQHLVFEEQGVELVAGRLVEWLAEVDAVDFGADGRAVATDGQTTRCLRAIESLGGHGDSLLRLKRAG
jgi:hypothetical protein